MKTIYYREGVDTSKCPLRAIATIIRVRCSTGKHKSRLVEAEALLIRQINDRDRHDDTRRYGPVCIAFKVSLDIKLNYKV
jgi:hypothetical protein